jgi:prepilin-type N-terminal cleavage/methylation domain-containing protein
MPEKNIHSIGRRGGRSDSRGFSLVEMLIAMAVLSLGLLAAASMHYGSMRNNSKGDVYTQARMLAKAQLETLKNQSIDDLVAGTTTETAIDAEGQSGGIYTRQSDISNWGNQARYITVTVSWTRLGKSDSVSITSKTGGGGV